MNSQLSLKTLLASCILLASVSANAWNNDQYQRGERYHDDRHYQQEYKRGHEQYNHTRYQHKHDDRREQARADNYGQWKRGEYLPVTYRASRYLVRDWRAYRLSAPPRGHQWLQVNQRFILVSPDYRIARIG